jgi:flavin-dependent dehydrogenase
LGEGLYYAISSGQMAAESIKQHAIGSLRDLSAYSDSITNAFDAQFMYAKRLSLLVNALPYVNVQLLKSSSTLQDMVVDLLRGTRTYQDIWQETLASFPELVKKLFSRKNA